MDNFLKREFQGLLDYDKALELQLQYHKLCEQGVYDAVFMALEHNPVITLGKHASSKDLLVSEEILAEKGVQVFRSDRGGQVTCHMPGQLVVYPIVSLGCFSLGVRDYVKLLEESLLDLLSCYGVQGELFQNNPGVWVSGKKIASIGVRVKERVSYHGIALNVTNSLELFQLVVPCGMKSCEMARLKDFTDQRLEMPELQKIFVESLTERLLFFKEERKVG